MFPPDISLTVGEAQNHLLDVALRLADGASIEWTEVGRELDAAEQRCLVRLQQLEALASVHSSGNGGNAADDSIRSAVERSDVTTLRWGPLEIIEKVGRGSYGDVYRARDPRLDRQVALKLLRHSNDEQRDEGALVDEGQALARLRHPNVVTVYGATTAEGRTGLWMEYIEGRTLFDEVKQRGPLPPAEIVQIGQDLCAAVAAVHRAGLLHRDIKAQNVMRASDGRVVLMDFGAGRDVAGTGIQGVAGTPLYISPEVLAGAPASVQSEVYSVGVLLWFLATGDFPLTGRTIDEIRRRHGCARVPSLRSVRPDLPRPLTRLVEDCLDADPRARVQDVGQLGTALARIATSRRRLGFRLVAGAAVVLLSTGGYAVWKPNRAATGARVPFQAGDVLLRVPFDNKTGDASLDAIVDIALERALFESNVVRIASRQRIADALRLMRKPLDTTLDIGVAREISQRDPGIRIIQAGSIERDRERFVLNAAFIDPSTGRVLAGASEGAPREGLDVAIRRLADRLRTTLGESHESIRQTASQLESVTTPSFEALRAYSESYRLGTSAQPPSWEAAQVLVTRALSIDPYFPAARIWNALTLYSLKAPVDEYRAAATSALEVVDRASPWEQHWIRALHHLMFEQLPDAAVEFEKTLSLRSDHEEASERLYRTYMRLRRTDDAARLAVTRAELRPNDVGLLFLASQSLGQSGGFDAARKHIERLELLLDGGDGGQPARAAAVHTWRAWDAILKRQPHEAVRLLDQLAARYEQWPVAGRQNLAMQLQQAYRAIGRASDARRYAHLISSPNMRQVTLATISRLDGDKKAARREIRSVSVHGLIDEGALQMGTGAIYQMIWAGSLDQATQELRRYDHVTLDPRALPTVEPRSALHGYLAFARGDTRRAAVLLEQAWKDTANFPTVRARTSEPLSDLLVEQGEIMRAISILREATPSHPAPLQPAITSFILLQSKVADLLRRTGGIAEAEAIENDLRALLAAADPDFPLLVELRKRTAAAVGK